MPASHSPADATSTPEGDAPWRGRPFSWEFTAPLYIGSALNPINSSLIATALLPIAHGLGVPVGQTAALVTALYLATAIAQPTAGKAAEVFGPRRVFLAGIVLVAVGGLVGRFAPDLITLLVSRVLIGLGTSCAYPTAMLLIRRRARAAGLDKPPAGPDLRRGPHPAQPEQRLSRQPRTTSFPPMNSATTVPASHSSAQSRRGRWVRLRRASACPELMPCLTAARRPDSKSSQAMA
jgi:hypothetical protein